MNLETRIAKLESVRSNKFTYVFCQRGETAEQAIERLGIKEDDDGFTLVQCFRWMEPGETAEPATVSPRPVT